MMYLTIKITGAYGTIANYARNGGDIFENDRNNQIMLNYRIYLIPINNELSTITFKLYVVYRHFLKIKLPVME